MRAGGFVIHLARAEQRRAQAEKLAGSLPVPTMLLDAVDARALSDEAVDAVYQRRLLRPIYPFTLRREEVGAFLSHRKAWQAILDGDFDAGLVVEDDVAFDPESLAAILELAKRAFQPNDYLRFPQRLRDDHGLTVAEAKNARLIRPRLPGRRMFMQLVGREAAQNLLDATQRFDRPVDSYLQMRWLLPVRVLAARPLCVREISGTLGGTTIQAKTRPFPDRLMREVARPLHRLMMQIYSFSPGSKI